MSAPMETMAPNQSRRAFGEFMPPHSLRSNALSSSSVGKTTLCPARDEVSAASMMAITRRACLGLTINFSPRAQCPAMLA